MTDDVDLRKADPEDVRALLLTAQPLDRPIPTTEFDSIARLFGWITTPTPGRTDPLITRKGAHVHTPWDFGRTEVRCLFQSDLIERIHIWISTAIRNPTDESRIFVLDAFAEYAALAQDILGPPTYRSTEDGHTLRWRRTHTTIDLFAAPSGVTLDLANNTYYDHWADSALMG